MRHFTLNKVLINEDSLQYFPEHLLLGVSSLLSQLNDESLNIVNDEDSF